MAAVGEILERKDRPALVRFVRRAQEDKAETLKQKTLVMRDVDWALITPPYSKDVIEIKVESWFKNMVLDVQNGRLPQQWSDQYHSDYDRWKRGEEPPLHGTAIRGWGVISPAQQEMLIRKNILTVEDLAVVNDEGIRSIGMAAMDLKNKAVAWLAQLKDKGPLTIEMAALKSDNATLKGQVETLSKQVETLLAASKITQAAAMAAAVESHDQQATLKSGLSASDIMPEL